MKFKEVNLGTFKNNIGKIINQYENTFTHENGDTVVFKSVMNPNMKNSLRDSNIHINLTSNNEKVSEYLKNMKEFYDKRAIAAEFIKYEITLEEAIAKVAKFQLDRVKSLKGKTNE